MWPQQTHMFNFRLLNFAFLFVLAVLYHCFWSSILALSAPFQRRLKGATSIDHFCPQVEALVPSGHEALLECLDAEFASSKFKHKAYESLGGAVRIPTETYDDLGPPSKDHRWQTRKEFHGYLESRFPKIHASLKLTKVNMYALVYEWKGTASVKPLLLTAHMDVVPVNSETYDDWIHPPYSGHYDGAWIWGRGSCDDKSGLISVMVAVESLLEHGFVPSRTILLAFGVDEEHGGRMGGPAIANHLLENYGPDSMTMIVDEGLAYSELDGTVFATPAVAEKGYMDIQIDVSTLGGHSSMPPRHTGIGILANLITELEAHPHAPKLVRGSTYYNGLECRAKHDTSFPASLKKLVLDSETSDDKLLELERRLADFDPMFSVLSGTTQAVDLVGGGIKVNVLPESAWTIVNHRIAEHSSVSELMSHFIGIIHPVAWKHNMTLEAFGNIVGSQDPSRGIIRLQDAFNASLNPAPVTPTRGSGPYELLSGTIRSTVETHLRTDGLPKSVVVSPGLMNGNTDTRHYWNLSKHIFRYDHWGTSDAYNGFHTINEAIRAEAFLEDIRFFTRLILNADRSDVLE